MASPRYRIHEGKEAAALRCRYLLRLQGICSGCSRGRARAGVRVRAEVRAWAKGQGLGSRYRLEWWHQPVRAAKDSSEHLARVRARIGC